MHIEEGFRDFKSHLGVRGLRLRVRISERVQRLLMGFTRLCARRRLGPESPGRGGAGAPGRSAEPRAAWHRAHLVGAPVAALLLGGLCGELQTALAAAVAQLLARTLAGQELYYLTRTL